MQVELKNYQELDYFRNEAFKALRTNITFCGSDERPKSANITPKNIDMMFEKIVLIFSLLAVSSVYGSSL